MKKFTTLVSTLLLILTLFCVNATAQTLGMFDMPITFKESSGDFKLDRNVVIHRQVRFIAPANQVIDIQPDINSTSRQIIPQGQSWTYTYSSSGDKKVSIFYRVYNTSSRQWETRVQILKLVVKSGTAAYQKPDETWTITTAENFTPKCESAAYPTEKPQKGFASVYIRYGAGHNNKLVRPIIFVDGVDFSTATYTDPNNGNKVIRHGSTGWDALTMGLDDGELDTDPETNGLKDYEAFQEYPDAFKSLTTSSEKNGYESYDIMFIDFSSGADYIQRNSLLLQELIRKVNQTKVANAQGVVFKNVVLGASMGGQVARHALTSMEKRGENHCTHTYVSFDSPQKGANIPLSVQAMGWFFNAIAAPDDADQKFFWKSLSTPAARQMIINHFGNMAKTGRGVSILPFSWSDNINTNIPEDFACLREEFVDEMKKLGYPKDARNIAISCGSTLGNTLANQGYSSGSELFDAHLGAALFGQVAQVQLYASGSSALNFLSSPTGYYVKSRCNPNAAFAQLPMNANPSNILFAVAVPSSFNQFLLRLASATPCAYKGIVIRNNNPSGLNMDHVQGCKRRDIPTIKRTFSNTALKEGTTFNLDDVNYKRSFCFMPTMSILDIQWDMTQANLEKPINIEQIVPQGLTPFAAIYAPNAQNDGGKNLKHVEITPTMLTWLQGELLIGETAGSATRVVANGTQLLFAKDGTISNSYWITQGAIVLNGDPSVKVTTGGCAPTLINVFSGGRIDVGSATTVGQLIIGANSEVNLRVNSILNVNNGSKIIVESGGKLIVNRACAINLLSSESTIHVKNGGELVINGDMNFTGTGFFQFDEGHILTLNTDLKLVGSGKTVRMIRLNSATSQTTFNTLKINGRGLNLSNAQVEYGSRCRIDITNDASSLNSITNACFKPFTGSNAVALNFGNVTNANIQSCDFLNLTQGINFNSAANLLQVVNIGLCNFSLVGTGISMVSPSWLNIPKNRDVRVAGCNFIYAANGTVLNSGTACKFQNMMQGISFENNSIKGYRSGTIWEAIIGIELYNSSIGIKNSVFTDLKTGVSAEKDDNNNVILAQSEISTCETGINMVGGTTSRYVNYPYGKVALTCSRLFDNVTGIKGTSVELGIDVRNTFQTLATNANSLLFDICYPTNILANSSNIQASNNFWAVLKLKSSCNFLRKVWVIKYQISTLFTLKIWQ